MKTDEAEQRLFDGIAKQLADLDARQEKQGKRSLWIYGAVGALFLGLFVVGPKDIWMAYLVMGVAIGKFLFHLGACQRRKAYCDVALPQMVALLGKDMTYRHKGGIKKSAYKASGLFPWSLRSYKSGNLVAGQRAGLDFRFGEIEVAQEPMVSRTHEWFTLQGIFLEAALPSPVAEKVLVVGFHRGAASQEPNALLRGMLLSSSLGRPEDSPHVGHKLKYHSIHQSLPPVVATDAPAFSSLFTVHAKHPEVARRLLSPALRQGLIELSEAVGGEVHVAFVRNKLYLMLPRTRTMHGLTVFLPKEGAYIRQYFETLRALLCFLDVLSSSREAARV